MADGFNRFNTGGQYFYPDHGSTHQRNLLHRNGSPIGNNRSLFQPNADTPSPNRSPGTNSPAHNPYSMYNHNSHRQNHGLLNGGATHPNFQPQMNLNKAFQNQNHGGHQGHHTSSQHQDHSGLGGHGGNYGNHQHNLSGRGLSNATPHFAPAHLQNGTPDNTTSLAKPPNEHWAEQLREYQRLKMADHRNHYYARTTPSVSSRYSGISPSITSRASDVEDHGDRRRVGEESDDKGVVAMDFCDEGLRQINPLLFQYYPKLQKVYFTYNKLRSIPPQIGEMRFLTMLDLSWNELHYLPPEIGMLTNLKKLLLFDNHLDDLPFEVGSLFQLEMLGIQGNPMRSDYKERLVEHGTQELVRFLREQAPTPEPPLDRAWIPLVEDAPTADTFTVLSWNILCERAATPTLYGYTPSEALSWQRRRDMIFDEITGRNADIICLQEMDIENYNEFFRPNLATEDYKGVYWPKSRAQTMPEKEAKVVDGCAIFYKNTKYILLDKQVIIFSREAISRPDMKGEHDVYNRVMPRDHVAVVAFLENRQTGSRLIVSNTHLTWEPWFSDIKIVQVAILMEHLAKLAETYAKWPPCKDKELYRYTNEDSADGTDGPRQPEPGPSLKYDEATQIPLLVCGDFNSTHSSGVIDLITQGVLANSHAELLQNNYGDFTRHGMSHPFNLKSSYSALGELSFTNYTPDFREAIDWVFHSTNTMQVTGLLDQVDLDHLRRVPGWPHYYFPSDHLALMVEYSIKERKERKAAVEADFGPSSRRDNNNNNRN